MKSLRKRSFWVCLTVVFLPILFSSIWYGRQVRQQGLDHALIEAIKKEDTAAAISLLNQGADANTTEKPYIPVTLKRLLADVEDRMKGHGPKNDNRFYPSALLLVVSLPPRSLNYNYEDGIKLPTDNPQLCKALLKHGAALHVKDAYGDTPLALACKYRLPKTLSVLLEYHSDPNTRNRNGRTALMLSSYWPSDTDNACAALLLEHGADVNATDRNGDTALMIGTMYRPSPNFVQFLIQYGAKVSIVDKDGNTALNYANRVEGSDLRSLLEEALRNEQKHRGAQK